MGEIQVNNTGSDGPISIVSIDEGFVVAWTNSRIIACARFSAAGARLGDNFTVNGPDKPATWPVMARLPGGFVVAWTSGDSLFLQPFTAGGDKNGDPMLISKAADANNPPTITRLLDRSLVAAWGDAGQSTVLAQRFGPDLSSLGRQIVVSPVNTPIIVNFQPVVSRLVDGGFVVVWRGGPSFGGAFSRIQFFNPNGTTSGDPQHPRLAKFDAVLRPGTIAPLPSAGFCSIGFGAGAQPTENVLMLDSYDSKGVHQFRGNVTHVDDHTSSALPMITDTTDPNKFILTFTLQNPADTGDVSKSIMATTATADLQVAPPFKISLSPARGAPTPCVTPAISDDASNIAFAWVDKSDAVPPASPSLKARVFSADNLSQDVSPT